MEIDNDADELERIADDSPTSAARRYTTGPLLLSGRSAGSTGEDAALDRWSMGESGALDRRAHV